MTQHHEKTTLLSYCVSRSPKTKDVYINAKFREGEGAKICSRQFIFRHGKDLRKFKLLDDKARALALCLHEIIENEFTNVDLGTNCTQ